MLSKRLGLCIFALLLVLISGMIPYTHCPCADDCHHHELAGEVSHESHTHQDVTDAEDDCDHVVIGLGEDFHSLDSSLGKLLSASPAFVVFATCFLSFPCHFGRLGTYRKHIPPEWLRLSSRSVGGIGYQRPLLI